MKAVRAELPDDLFDSLVGLAIKRGVSANTVLLQAIHSELFMEDVEASGGSLLTARGGRVDGRVVRRAVPR